VTLTNRSCLFACRPATRHRHQKTAVTFDGALRSIPKRPRWNYGKRHAPRNAGQARARCALRSAASRRRCSADEAPIHCVQGHAWLLNGLYRLVDLLACDLMRAGANNLDLGCPRCGHPTTSSSRRCNPLRGQGMPNLRRPWTAEDDARLHQLLEVGASISIVAVKRFCHIAQQTLCGEL
jgi:hypothetical protein